MIRFRVQFKLICTSEFFKKQKSEKLWRVQFQLFEKLTSSNYIQIERKTPYNYSLKMKKVRGGSAGRSFLSLFFPFKKTSFKVSAQNFRHHFT